MTEPAATVIVAVGSDADEAVINGMGGAQVAAVDDGTAAWSNPAVLGRLEGWAVGSPRYAEQPAGPMTNMRFP